MVTDWAGPWVNPTMRFTSSMRLYPEKGMGFAILANGTDLDREGSMDMLARMEW
jgi:hypothetical protein